MSFYESCFYTDDIGDGSYADEYNISLAGGLELYSEVSLLQKKFNQNEKIDINNFNNWGHHSVLVSHLIHHNKTI